MIRELGINSIFVNRYQLSEIKPCKSRVKLGLGVTSGQQRPGSGFIPNPKLKLLDQVREVMRLKHYSIHTERSSVIGSGACQPVTGLEFRA